MVRPSAAGSSQPLFDFKDSDIKFQLASLMNILRDSRHESWVLAAYPDPKTSRPLIGAGFSLDVAATDHPQRDPLNPHPFMEPSSAQLWQAAGLNPKKLQIILDQYDRDLDAWKKKNFRRKIRTHQLSPELTDEEATKLLRISAIQATYNARAYCRMFDQLTASQQMALSQLVFQMGVNLEEFTQFISTVNEPSYRDVALAGSGTAWEAEHWKTVQSTLIQSQWARRYTSRAVSVIAMFDPAYAQNPSEAERKVQAQIRPKAAHHRNKARVRSVRAKSDTTPHQTVQGRS
jgi:GH24 family phage-related lysozyme (muramidase)